MAEYRQKAMPGVVVFTFRYFLRMAPDRKAAEQGNARAQFNLGWCLEKGTGGVAKDEKAAVEWYRKAAEQGYAEAHLTLGQGPSHQGLSRLIQSPEPKSRAIDRSAQSPADPNGSARRCSERFA